MRRVDAIILGGTKGCPKLKIGDIEEHKQFLELGGKTMIDHVIEAALGCPDVRNVYVVGDAERLASHGAEVIVPDYGSLVGNIWNTFCSHVLPGAGYDAYDNRKGCSSYHKYFLENNPDALDHEVVLLHSDAPFMTPEDISQFISETADSDVDYSIGLGEERAFRMLEEEVGQELCMPETKSALLPLDNTYVRWNNMVRGKPLKVPPEAWSVLQGIYDKRYLLDNDGGEKKRNWTGIVRMFWDYVQLHSERRPTIVKGFLRGVTCFTALYMTYHTGSALPRLFLGKEDFEKAAYEISGKKLKGRLHISDVVHPGLDIDNAEMYLKLKADGEQLYHKLMESQRQYLVSAEAPEKALERMVMERPELFWG
ncbi:MAG: NTP transferase domain-containing protein [Candidatus Woesearchaeota archaeon]